ncbi:uncharacterized protein VP01_748g7 [Puccinia sorghi]|uniref:Uncharacterized protein n=1 Tax=Puccinia sorghi TaxID=27349 RepID=A0A0L6UCC3_9BASI|nr:uncharacterized protein VP01_748g7 [Puccinia sorghi]
MMSPKLSATLTSKQIISKLTKYLVFALEKPAPICSIILDLKINLKHIEKKHVYLVEHKTYNLTVENTLKSFKCEAQPFDCSSNKIQTSSTSQCKKKLAQLPANAACQLMAVEQVFFFFLQCQSTNSKKKKPVFSSTKANIFGAAKVTSYLRINLMVVNHQPFHQRQVQWVTDYLDFIKIQPHK